MSPERVRQAFAELEEMGFIQKTGEFRPSPITGKPQPVYVTTKAGREHFGDDAPEWLQ